MISWIKPHEITRNNFKVLRLSLKKFVNVPKYKNDNLCEKDWVNSQLTISQTGTDIWLAELKFQVEKTILIRTLKLQCLRTHRANNLDAWPHFQRLFFTILRVVLQDLHLQYKPLGDSDGGNIPTILQIRGIWPVSTTEFVGPMQNENAGPLFKKLKSVLAEH